MQIKISVLYNYSLTSTAKMKRLDSPKVRKDAARGTVRATGWRGRNWPKHCGTVWHYLLKLKKCMPCGSAILLQKKCTCRRRVQGGPQQHQQKAGDDPNVHQPHSEK